MHGRRPIAPGPRRLSVRLLVNPFLARRSRGVERSAHRVADRAACSSRHRMADAASAMVSRGNPPIVNPASAAIIGTRVTSSSRRPSTVAMSGASVRNSAASRPTTRVTLFVLVGIDQRESDRAGPSAAVNRAWAAAGQHISRDGTRTPPGRCGSARDRAFTIVQKPIVSDTEAPVPGPDRSPPEAMARDQDRSGRPRRQCPRGRGAAWHLRRAAGERDHDGRVDHATARQRLAGRGRPRQRPPGRESGDPAGDGPRRGARDAVVQSRAP